MLNLRKVVVNLAFLETFSQSDVGVADKDKDPFWNMCKVEKKCSDPSKF